MDIYTQQFTAKQQKHKKNWKRNVYILSCLQHIETKSTRFIYCTVCFSHWDDEYKCSCLTACPWSGHVMTIKKLPHTGCSVWWQLYLTCGNVQAKPENIPQEGKQIWSSIRIVFHFYMNNCDRKSFTFDKIATRALMSFIHVGCAVEPHI